MALTTKEQYLHRYKNMVDDADINKKLYDEFLEQIIDDYCFKRYKESVICFHKAYSITYMNRPIKEVNLDDIERAVVNVNRPARYTFNLIVKFLSFLEGKGIALHETLSGISEIEDFLHRNSGNGDTYVKINLLKNRDRLYVKRENNSVSVFHIDVADSEIFEMFKSFIDINIDGSYGTRKRKLALGFEKSCSIDLTPETLSFDILKKQLTYFASLDDGHYLTPMLISFYFFIAKEYGIDVFKDVGLSLSNINQSRLIESLLSGYEVVSHNVIEIVPDCDKWMFIKNGQVTNNTSPSSKYTLLDFSQIENSTYRQWVKTYIWTTGKLETFDTLIKFCNTITNFKNGTLLSIYATVNDNIDISMNELFAYRILTDNTYSNTYTKSNIIARVKHFLKEIQRQGLGNFPYSIDYCLSYKWDNTKNDANAIPDNELKMLANLLHEKAKSDTTSALHHLAFYIALETEFRISQILALTVDCVRETSKPNEYVLVSKTKTSNKESVEQPITIYVKRHVDEIIKLTQEYRDDCYDEKLKQCLFLRKVKGRNINTYDTIRTYLFGFHLKQCCEELNIPIYSASNLRDTHMTKAEEFVIRNQLSDMQQNVLSGHSSPTIDNKYYVDTDIRDMLEAVHGIIIGDVDINGKILNTETDVARHENSVSNGCGYCNANACTNFSMLDCLMCKDFVTTIDRLPYFEEQVKMIDKRIQEASIPHDKEDLINIKRLYLGFINEILKLKERNK